MMFGSRALTRVMRKLKNFSKTFLPQSSSTTIPIRIVDPFLRLWFFLGLVPYEEYRRVSWRSYVAYFYPRFIFIMACYQSSITTGIYMYIHRRNIVSVIDGVSILSIFCMTVCKPATYILQKTKLINIIKKLDAFYDQGHNGNTYEMYMFKNVRFFVQVFAVYIPVACTVTGWSLVAAALLTMIPRRLMLFQGWYPYNQYISPYFELTVVYRLVVICMNLQIIGLCDSLLTVLFGVTLAQYKILSNRFKTIREVALQNIKERKILEFMKKLFQKSEIKYVPIHASNAIPFNAIEIQRCLKVDDPILHSSFCKPRPNAAKTSKTLRAPKKKMIQHLESKLEIDQEMERLMKKYVKHHQKLLRLTNELEELINPTLINQLLSNMVASCCIALSYTMDKTVSAKTYYFGILLFLMLVQLCVFSWFGNEITQESADMKFSAYECDWLEASESFKRSMRIVISRSQVPVIFRAAGFVPLSMEVFHSVTKTGYSNYMVLRTITSK